jgi:hypothetical protein
MRLAERAPDLMQRPKGNGLGFGGAEERYVVPLEGVTVAST